MWCIMPVLNNWAITEQAAYDLLGQSVPTKILIPAQGVDDDLRLNLEKLAEKFPDRVFCLFWNPPMPALSMVWNRCLEMIWSLGETEAFVVNNDVRLHTDTIQMLSRGKVEAQALFVSAVGVTAEQFRMETDCSQLDTSLHGGPDFSCFLISKECHEKYPFDAHFIPAFLEDLSCHREIMLAGEGRRIFSINVPYLHYASQTLKTMTPERRAAAEAQISAGSRRYYQAVWGGPANEETYLRKGDPSSAVTDGSATTPYLQHHQKPKD